MFLIEWWIKWEICEDAYQFSPRCLIHFKFSGAEKLHDPTNMELVSIKNKGKLHRKTKSQPTKHVKYIFVFIWDPVNFRKFHLWGEYIFAFYYQWPTPQ